MKFYDKNGIMFDSGSNEKEKENSLRNFLNSMNHPILLDRHQ